jgi:hypothetical protein
MTLLQRPDRVLTDASAVALLEASIAALPDEAKVQLTLDDGSVLRGIVTVRPSVQVFRMADGSQGVNAGLRLDDLESPGHTHYLWLDRVRDIFPLGSA